MISCNFILFNILTQWFYDLIFYDFMTSGGLRGSNKIVFLWTDFTTF